MGKRPKCGSEKAVIKALIRCDKMLQDHECRLNKLEAKKPRPEEKVK
jgi:hypothetical protein